MSSAETQVVWNTKETPEGQAPFLTENYKLLIYDSNSTATAPPRAGYLGAFSGFTFGMYLPQPYTSLQGKSSSVVFSDKLRGLTKYRWLELPQLQLRPVKSRTNDAHNHALHLRNNSRFASVLYIPIWPVVMKQSSLARLHPDLASPPHPPSRDAQTQRLDPWSLTITAFLLYASLLSIYLRVHTAHFHHSFRLFVFKEKNWRHLGGCCNGRWSRFIVVFCLSTDLHKADDGAKADPLATLL